MAIIKNVLGPKSDADLEAFAIEDLVFDVQIAIQKAMNGSCTTQRELSDRLGISPARVSQMFAAGGANLTLKTIAKVLHALDDKLDVQLASEIERKSELLSYMSVSGVSTRRSSSRWIEANDNIMLLKKAA